jgi:plasmid stabilization system protein ParE
MASLSARESNRSTTIGESRFRKYLVFYRPIPGGIEVLRVLHGSRDIAAILAEAFAAEDDHATGAETEPKT